MSDRSFLDTGIGARYRDSQVKPYSHYKDPIDRSPGRLAGNSRRWGDAPAEVKAESARLLIEEAKKHGLSQKETALLLAIAKLESGFNPDAAAGTTSALGLGQFVKDTGATYGLKGPAIFDARAQAKALVEHFIDNKKLADKHGHGPEYIYKYHHDGPSRDYGGLRLSLDKVVPEAARIEAELVAKDWYRHPEKLTGTRTQDVYVVKPGDTLAKIAKALGTTVDAIAKANGIADANRIEVGQKLVIEADALERPGTDGRRGSVERPGTPTPGGKRTDFGDLIEGEAVVTSHVGSRVHPTKGTRREHNGVDIATTEGKGKTLGKEIYAPAPGRVVRNFYDAKGGGWVTTLEHYDAAGLVTGYTQYLHQQKQSPLKEGTWVDRGRTIGHVGATGGISTGAHLHYEEWRAKPGTRPLAIDGDNRTVSTFKQNVVRVDPAKNGLGFALTPEEKRLKAQAIAQGMSESAALQSLPGSSHAIVRAAVEGRPLAAHAELPQWLAQEVPNAIVKTAPQGATFAGSVVALEANSLFVQIGPRSFVQLPIEKVEPLPMPGENVRISPSANGFKATALKADLAFQPVLSSEQQVVADTRSAGIER